MNEMIIFSKYKAMLNAWLQGSKLDLREAVNLADKLEPRHEEK